MIAPTVGGMLSYALVCFRMRWDALGCLGMRWDAWACVGILGDVWGRGF